MTRLARKLPHATVVSVLLHLIGTPIGLAQQGGRFEAEFVLSRSPSVAVLEYTRDIGAIAEPDPEPILRIYGDGRYVVHYPTYMREAGDWQGRIPMARLNALVRSAIEGRLLEFNPRAVRNELRATERATRQEALRSSRPQELSEVSHRDSTRIRVRVERYKPAGVIGVVGEPVDKEILWWGLRRDVELHPRVPILQELAALESQLRALAESSTLERLSGEVHQ